MPEPEEGFSVTREYLIEGYQRHIAVGFIRARSAKHALQLFHEGADVDWIDTQPVGGLTNVRAVLAHNADSEAAP